MALTPKSIEFITKWISENGTRTTAVKILDQILRKKIGLTSSDLSDTITFSNGLDAMESLLSKNKFQEAYNKGITVANKMIKEENGGLFENMSALRIFIRKTLNKKLINS